jgi:hypothetical protein
LEASEGGVEDCTGSEYSFVETSGETASGAAASGAAASGLAASGAAAPGAAASGADCVTEAVGDGVRKTPGAVVGEGGSGVAQFGEDREGADWRRWVARIGEDGGMVGGGGVRTGEGGVVSRGERERASSSPLSLNSSTSHRLLAAFLVRLAGRGEGFEEKTGECSDRGGSGRGDSSSGRSDTASLSGVVGDSARVDVGEEAGGCSGRGGACSGNSDPRQRCRRRRRRARGATLACGGVWRQQESITS